MIYITKKKKNLVGFFVCLTSKSLTFQCSKFLITPLIRSLFTLNFFKKLLKIKMFDLILKIIYNNFRDVK